MSYLHPASQILLGLAFLLAASTRNGFLLLLLCAAVMGFALGVARRHFTTILRRSRWLLLTMLLLFGWMTLGTPVAGLPGATREGLLLAAESVARLLIAISVVALLLESLPPPALVAGLRSLLATLALPGDFRDRLAVRLMLTLQEVDAARSGTSEPTMSGETFSLPVSRRGPADLLAAVCSASLLLFAAFA